MNIELINGDCIEEMKKLNDNSVDAVVCDPPYELGFMGKKWDNSGIAYNVDVWREALRVLKPGGHLLAFGGTRTYHRMAVAIEDAGFEVRDMLEWIYASGFPKSLNIGKKIDDIQGNKREVIGYDENSAPDLRDVGRISKETIGIDKLSFGQAQGAKRKQIEITKGNSEWEGFGTALKPAHEPIIMARKPLSEKTIVENVLKYGTGAIDIDGTRIPLQDEVKRGGFGNGGIGFGGGDAKNVEWKEDTQGRFPANIICTDDALNDGVIEKGIFGGNSNAGSGMFKFGEDNNKIGKKCGFGDSGSKSRYFDIDVWAEKHGLLQFPKASKRERNEGCEGLETKGIGAKGNGLGRVCETCGVSQLKPEDCKCEVKSWINPAKNGNHHPTVKPAHLMSWLVRLVSKEGDTVLDPFTGSGTTGVACKKLNRNFIGIELNKEYCEIAKHRIDKS